MASTADEVEIVQWLRVWTATLDPGTVDLTAPWACTAPPDLSPSASTVAAEL